MALLEPTLPEADAMAILKELRAEEKQFQEQQLELRKKQIELQKEEITTQTHNLRTLLYEVQLRAMNPQCVNHAALFAMAIIPMRHRPEVHARFRGFQRTILGSYPSNDDGFDWAAHLLALQMALYDDETQALSLSNSGVNY